MRSALALLLVSLNVVSAQTVEQLQQRLSMGSAAPAGRGTDTPLIEKTWDQLPDKQLFEYGKQALGDEPKKWHHAETPHFVIHFRRRIDAQKVARQAEFYYQQVKTDLMAATDRFDRKNHVFLFEKPEAWTDFVAMARVPEWSAGFSYRSELFFVSRQGYEFAASTLAHEVTHCIFYRFVPKPIPLWLNEGFAEFESGNAYSKFKGIGGGSRGSGRQGASDYPLEKLLAAKDYPDKEGIHEFYHTSERVVRFLLTRLERKGFVPLVEKLADGASLEAALTEVYPGKFKTFAEFIHAYQRFQ